MRSETGLDLGLGLEECEDLFGIPHVPFHMLSEVEKALVTICEYSKGLTDQQKQALKEVIS